MQKLKDKKIAILLCDGFEEVEMTQPRKALEKEGAIVHLIVPEQTSVYSFRHDHWGKKFKTDVLLKNAKPTEYDAVLFPGGVLNPDKLRTYKAAVKFAKHFFKNKKPIAAICHGSITLIETDDLKNRTMTSYPSIKTDLINAGVKWKNKQVVIDNNLVTSRNPKDIPAFNKAIIKLFQK